jgi:hypothetical protein
MPAARIRTLAFAALASALAALAPAASTAVAAPARSRSALGIAVAAARHPTAVAARRRRPPPPRRRPGCGTFCQQAGLPQGDDGGTLDPAHFFGPSHLRVSGGAVHVRLKCILKITCRGALVLFDDFPGRPGLPTHVGGADLTFAPGAIANLEVPINAAGLRKLATRGSILGSANYFEAGKCGPKSCQVLGISGIAIRLLAPIAPSASAARAALSARAVPIAVAARRRPPRRRPGCGTFCQQAGPPAGGGPGSAPLSDPIEFYGRVYSDHGGEIAVPVRCLLRVACRGAIGVYPLDYDYRPSHRIGAVDLLVAARKRATVQVPLSAYALRLLRARPTLSALLFAFQAGACFSKTDCATSGVSTTTSSVTIRAR